MSLIDKMKERVMDIINPDVEYTQEDFNKITAQKDDKKKSK